MVNKLMGMLVIVLTFGMVVSGCDNGTTGDDGGVSEKVRNLPSFEGVFVGSEQEASILASGADAQIQTAISQALTQSPQGNKLGQSRAVQAANGHYEYNGIKLDYTAVYSDDFETNYPCSMKVSEVVGIDGVYNGYTIKGSYNITYDCIYTSASVYSIKYKYNCIYSVSYNGKGMKVVTTGDMTMTSSYSYTYDFHYAVYDNNNTIKYNYDYKL